ncbi:MAG: hypothetical protein ABSC55_21650 [Syntrophorhabdales bacterium]|jgi:hypothetical protein
MKRLIVAVIMFVVGFAGYAAAEDLIEQDLKILADQYTAASGYGDTQLFASNFRSYMIGSNRLDAAAEQQRKIYRFSFDTSIGKFETTGDKKSCVVANADYESKRNGQTLAKGKITATYSVRNDKLVLVMVKFADEVVKYKDAEKLANEKTQEKEKNVTYFPGGPNSAPDFSAERKQEREI